MRVKLPNVVKMPFPSCEKCNLIIWVNNDSVTFIQSIEVWLVAVAECFRVFFLIFFFPAICISLWKAYRKFVARRLEFSAQTLNLRWKNVHLTSFDFEIWKEKPSSDSVAAEIDKKSVCSVLWRCTVPSPLCTVYATLKAERLLLAIAGSHRGAVNSGTCK